MPRTLAQNATYINETIKPAIKSAIEAQGVTVPSTDSFLDYADRIGEIEGGGSGYQLKDLPTGSISTVNDAAPLPLNALKVSVEAWQEGSGTPSPSNIRPIHGWDSGEISVVGKNWVKYDNANNPDRTKYSYSEESAERTVCTKTVDGGLFVLQYLIHLRKGETYCFSFDSYTHDSISQTEAQIFIYSNGLWGSLITFFSITKTGITWTSTYTGTAVLGIFNTQSAGTEIVFEKLMISKGAISTAYEPYQSKQYTQQFPQTIYGAEWGVVNGELKQTDGYIASYNGETLPSSWISDRDVYDGTNTPTIGAEVVYKLATPTTIDLSPLSIRLLEGTNNLYADCGEVLEGEYFSGDNQLYANGIIFAGEGDSGIGSYRKIDTLPTALLNATAMTCEVCARFDSFVNLSSGPYARIITFGDDGQTGRFGHVGLLYDGSSEYNLCVWDGTADITSGLCEWTPTDTHTVAVVKTTAGTIKIYVDGVLKYTGSSALTITNNLIDYITQRARTNTPSDTLRKINGEIFAWRVYGKELSASQINANFLVDKINYID